MAPATSWCCWEAWVSCSTSPPDSACGRSPAADRRRDPMTVRIVIAAGGTAGHVVPALAVADALRSEGAEVVFVGGERAEAELVPAAGYDFRRISVAAISRSNPLAATRA